MKNIKLSNIMVMGDKIELWETKEKHIEKLVLSHEQFEQLTKHIAGNEKIYNLNKWLKNTSFSKRYQELKDQLGYEVEKISPIIHNKDLKAIK